MADPIIPQKQKQQKYLNIATTGVDSPDALRFRHLKTHPTAFDPHTDATVAMSVRMDGCIVPSQASDVGARIAFSHMAVLDNFVDPDTQRSLRDFLVGNRTTFPETTARSPPENAPATASDARDNRIPVAQQRWDQVTLPEDRWERGTADMAGGPATWGLRPQTLERLASGCLPALIEVQSRLAKLYPEYEIVHLPSAAIQRRGSGDNAAGSIRQARHDAGGGADVGAISSAVDCSAILANAAVQGDTYRYHVDADPTSFPCPSPWTDAYGDYVNGEPGKPLLVSMLLYLNERWDRDWGAETLFLDGETEVGICVRPRPGRIVLMDQDMLHRVSVPSDLAGTRPRLSLVWKLAFLPRRCGQEVCLHRPEWGLPVSIGSAARVEAVKRQLAREVKRSRAE